MNRPRKVGAKKPTKRVSRKATPELLEVLDS
jgi:hypothetical protein